MDSSILSVVIRGDSMWPSYNDGDTIECANYSGQDINIGDIVVFKHPLKHGIKCVKRVYSICEDGVFVVGDNPDPNCSEDSHNFGPISTNNIVAMSGPGGT
ncbi:MAG: S26 family signal peptidase [Candidatus Poseidoniaceae archaeon]|nr:S26 family signal peptidase [Candidatus Poseidoniaceae archaeon]